MSSDARFREVAREAAIEAARLGGAVLLDHARHGFRVEHKNVVNLVTDADRRAEATIVAALLKAFPDHEILAEEEGLRAARHSAYRWVIDPLDGTTNFAHRFPAYCVSIGLEFEGRPMLGVVLDPTRDELFVGETGRGASLNGEPLRVSQVATLDAALLVTGFAYDIRETPENNLDHFARFALRAQGVRADRDGGAGPLLRRGRTLRRLLGAQAAPLGHGSGRRDPPGSGRADHRLPRPAPFDLRRAARRE